MPDQHHDKVKLNVRVTPSKKKGWQDSLNDGETLSSLVRRAVDHEIRDEYVSKDVIEDIGGVDQPDLEFDVLFDRIEELQKTVEALESKFDNISASNSTEEEEGIEELAMSLLHRLPAIPGDIPKSHLREVGQIEDMETREVISMFIEASRKTDEFSLNGTAQRLAREAQEPTPKVRQALLYLEHETTEDVKSEIVGEKRHWVRGV